MAHQPRAFPPVNNLIDAMDRVSAPMIFNVMRGRSDCPVCFRFGSLGGVSDHATRVKCGGCAVTLEPIPASDPPAFKRITENALLAERAQSRLGLGRVFP